LKTRFVTTTKNSGYTLGYTNAHQLASEAYSNTNYDFGPPSTTGTASYTAANVLNQYPGVTPLGGTAQSLTYDANANLTFDGVLSYTYNPQNRLMLVQNGTTQVATYAYDGVDRRVTKTVGSTVTNFLDDGEDEIAEYDGSGDVLRRFVPGRAINDPIAYDNCVGATAPNCTGTVTVEYFHSDHHGSVVAMSAASGSLLGNPSEGPFTYDAYGVSPSTMTGVPFRYVGMYYDAETGLYYDRARYYSSALGRFLQDDALLYKDDLDLYTYVGNDPTDKTDPKGLEAACVSSPSGCDVSASNFADNLQAASDLSEGAAAMFMSNPEIGGSLVGKPLEEASLGLARASALVRAALGTERMSVAAMTIDDAQFGAKAASHMSDFGLNPSSAADRAAFRGTLESIGNKPDRVVDGTFSDQGPNGTRGPVQFRIQGSDVVVTTRNGKFVTVLKGGINNTSVQTAIKASTCHTGSRIGC